MNSSRSCDFKPLKSTFSSPMASSLVRTLSLSITLSNMGVAMSSPSRPGTVWCSSQLGNNVFLMCFDFHVLLLPILMATYGSEKPFSSAGIRFAALIRCTSSLPRDISLSSSDSPLIALPIVSATLSTMPGPSIAARSTGVMDGACTDVTLPWASRFSSVAPACHLTVKVTEPCATSLRLMRLNSTSSCSLSWSSGTSNWPSASSFENLSLSNSCKRSGKEMKSPRLPNVWSFSSQLGLRLSGNTELFSAFAPPTLMTA
mmetsp:Transcript_8908/g.14928  ORF Transcript_8908/g.14928 Transcript_8908/m.14928 type:complete len:259 (-) Transcript_8908:2168-2944(-)